MVFGIAIFSCDFTLCPQRFDDLHVEMSFKQVFLTDEVGSFHATEHTLICKFHKAKKKKPCVIFVLFHFVPEFGLLLTVWSRKFPSNEKPHLNLQLKP